MPTVHFTPHLSRYAETSPVEALALTLRGALDEAFARHPRLRAYVLDDQAGLRANVMVFVDGQRCDERRRLDRPLAPDSSVHVLQALSGG